MSKTKKNRDTGLKVGPLPAKPTWEKVSASSIGARIGVDRENNKILGYVIAEEGPFKTAGRGRFDLASLITIRDMINARQAGLKSRFTHPDESNDGLGKFLGRAANARLDKRTKEDDDGTLKSVNIVRGDLTLDPTSFETPSGNLGKYILDLAASDPDALSSSLVLEKDDEYELDAKERPVLGDDGERLPPIWRPTKLHASDVVDTGDAVDGFLSAGTVDQLPNALAFRAAELLDKQFAGATREVVQARCLSYLDRYLDRRYGPEAGGTPGGALDGGGSGAGNLWSHNDHVAENEPDWGQIDRDKLPDAAFADMENRNYAHHWVEDPIGLDAAGHYSGGTMHLHSQGLKTAQNSAKSHDAPQSICDHLQAHCDALDGTGATVSNNPMSSGSFSVLGKGACPPKTSADVSDQDLLLQVDLRLRQAGV